jgi:sporulation protein YlmC with PRC-barrel domain
VSAHIQIIGVEGKAAEIYGENALHHRIQYDGNYIIRIDLNKDKCSSIQKPVEVIIKVFRPISGTLERVTETIQRTNTYTTTSYRESIYSTLYTDMEYNPVEIYSVRKQSLLPNWLILPFIVIAVGLISAFLVLRQQRVNRSLTNLGVLLLEDKYFPKEELIEKPVYNSRGMKIGQIIDVGYSINGQVALVVGINKDKEKIIPFTQIEEIGDIVLLSPEAEKLREKTNFKSFRKSSHERTR